MKTRRQFLLNGAIGLAAATALPATGLATGAKGARRQIVSSLDEMNLGAFQRLLRGRFEVQGNDQRRASLELVGIEDHLPPSGEHFTLLFSGSLAEKLQQDTYQFGHPGIGTFTLMIVPGRTTHKQQVYAALINRTA